jgi:hypothetical protein
MPGKDIPEIKWGTFYDKSGTAHVAPVINGYLMDGHVLSAGCQCGPTIDRHPKVKILVHYVVH